MCERMRTVCVNGVAAGMMERKSGKISLVSIYGAKLSPYKEFKFYFRF